MEEKLVRKRIAQYVKEEIGKDSSAIAWQVVAGVTGVVGLGVYEGALVFNNSPQHAIRYALSTAIPSFAGKSVPHDLIVRNMLQQMPIPTKPPGQEGALAVRLSTVQSGRHLIAFATLVGVAFHIGSGMERGRQRYHDQVANGREPPLVPPSAVRLSSRPPSSTDGGSLSTFHVAFEGPSPWHKSSSSSSATGKPRRWWTRPQWSRDPREWTNILSDHNSSSSSSSSPLFLEAELPAMGKPGCLPIDVILESLRAAKRAAIKTTSRGKEPRKVVRVLVAGDASRPEESGMADIVIDGETAVSMAALAWMEKTPYATSWAAMAAERTKADAQNAEKKHPVLKKWEEIWASVAKVPVPKYIKPSLKWVYDSWEGLGRQLRWLMKGGVTVGDAFDEYKVVVLVHDADLSRLSQRSKLKALLKQAGWDVWGPGSSTSRLVQDWNAPVPVLVYCQDDATTIERARFLVRAGRPRELTCAVLEEPEATSPWLDTDENRPTVISVADIHDGIFDFVRLRIKEGRTIPQVQSEIDASMGIQSSSPSPSKV